MYKKAVVKTKIERVLVAPKQLDEQGVVIEPAQYANELVLPCKAYHMTVVVNGNNHYCNIPQGEQLAGVECLAYVIYIDTEYDLTQWEGYIGDPATEWDKIKADAFYLAHWPEKDLDGNPTPIYFGMVMDDVGR